MAANASKFKVGDRVRVVRHCNWQGDAIKMNTPIGEVRQIAASTALLHREGVDTFLLEGDDNNFYCDINLEPAPSPIRTVTRREIVPGAYGAVNVHDDGRVDAFCFTATDLREAAHIFNQIAEVLEEQEAA